MGKQVRKRLALRISIIAIALTAVLSGIALKAPRALGLRNTASLEFPIPPIAALRKPATQSGGANPGNGNGYFGHLALQPEANKVRGLLGLRYQKPGLEISTLTGNVSYGSERHAVQIVRRQDPDGEKVAVGLDGAQPALGWDGKGGAQSGGSPATGTARWFLERMVLDTADQFVLAQLRGASYHTVARGALPEGIDPSSNYSGPIYDVVRVGEPQTGTYATPLSPWRAYFINSATGFTDKVVSQEGNDSVTAVMSGWTAQGTERVPSKVSWTINGQVVMEFALSSITFASK
jgi:hypothetical protein